MFSKLRLTRSETGVLTVSKNRFAQFFISPTFNENSVEREVNAVNAENDKNMKTDVWRDFTVECATCDRNHDYSKFGTGE